MSEKEIKLKKDLVKSLLKNAFIQIQWLRIHGHVPTLYLENIENEI